MNITKTPQSLQAKIEKHTKQRESILSIFTHAQKPLTITELNDRLKTKFPNIHRATVYRTIQFMVDKGSLRKLDLGQRTKSYELNSLDHHHHFVCDQCSRAINIKPTKIEKAIEQFEISFTKKYKHKIDRHTMKFFGTCVSCINKHRKTP